jgi:hypothetical protein
LKVDILKVDILKVDILKVNILKVNNEKWKWMGYILPDVALGWRVNFAKNGPAYWRSHLY